MALKYRTQFVQSCPGSARRAYRDAFGVRARFCGAARGTSCGMRRYGGAGYIGRAGKQEHAAFRIPLYTPAMRFEQ